MYYHADMFSFSMQKLDEEGNQQSVIFWTSLVIKEHQELFYKQFIEKFFHPAMSILSSSTKPRISEDIKRILNLIDQARIGDRYLYQNYIVIRVYGCELAPYKLQKYLPMSPSFG